MHSALARTSLPELLSKNKRGRRSTILVLTSFSGADKLGRESPKGGQYAKGCANVLSMSLLRKISTTEANVVKTPPYLFPKGEGGKEHGWKSAVREKLLSREAVQLGRIW